jgi:hypothetical protein
VPHQADYLAWEARIAALGAAGEEFVLDYERARLCAGKNDSLAGKVEHVFKTKGDGPATPSYACRNELDVSQEQSGQYRLYRLFQFGRTPRMFVLVGALDGVCKLEPSESAARVA